MASSPTSRWPPPTGDGGAGTGAEDEDGPARRPQDLQAVHRRGVPEEPALLGLVSRLAPVILSGNTAVVLASERKPLPAVTLCEVLATSDVPGGVVNVLTGLKKELVPWLASHMDVNAIDITGVPEHLVPEVEAA